MGELTSLEKPASMAGAVVSVDPVISNIRDMLVRNLQQANSSIVSTQVRTFVSTVNAGDATKTTAPDSVEAAKEIAEAVNGTAKTAQSAAEAAQVAQKTAEALKDEVAGLTGKAQEQFAAKAAQLEELIQTQSAELKKATEKAQSTFGQSFVAFGKEHKTMLIAGSVGVVVIGGIIYIVHKTGTLTKLKEWFKGHPIETAQLIVYGGLGTLAAAGLGVANQHYDWVDLKATGNSALETGKGAGSWVGEQYTEHVAPYVGSNTIKVAGGIGAVTALGVIGTLLYKKSRSAQPDQGKEKSEEKSADDSTPAKTWRDHLPSMSSASSFRPSFLSGKPAKEEAKDDKKDEAKKDDSDKLAEEEAKEEDAEKLRRSEEATRRREQQEAAARRRSQEATAKLAEAKTELLAAANNMNAEQVTEFAKKYSPAVQSAAADFVSALKGRATWNPSTVEGVRGKGKKLAVDTKLIEAYDKLARTLK